MAIPDNTGDNRNCQQQQSLRRRLFSPGMLPMTRGSAPSTEETVAEGYHLLYDFMHEELNRQGLDPPDVTVPFPNGIEVNFARPLVDTPRGYAADSGQGDVQFDGHNVTDGERSSSSVAASDPKHFKKIGHGIRQLAEEFINSTQGRKVKDQADAVDLKDLNFETFQALLEGVFHDGKFSRTAVIAVFVFCSGLVANALRKNAPKIIKKVINWCFEFLRDGVCKAVQQQGGWEAVLDSVYGQVLRIFATGFVITTAVAVLYLMWKS